MAKARFAAFLIAALGAALSAAHATEDVRSLVEEGRTEDARRAIARTLSADETSEDGRATALRWLGRLEVADKNYSEALRIFERLTSEFGATPAGRDAATELALLTALAGPSDLTAEPTAVVAETRPEPEPPAPPQPKAEPEAPSPTPAPQPEPAPSAPTTSRQSEERSGRILVGAFGAPFNSAEDAALRVQDFLNTNGIETDFEITASQALRGSDAVIAYLLSLVRETSASGLVLVRSRWGFREFIEVECYTPRGKLLWREKVSGGRYYRDEAVTDKLMDRLFAKLPKHVGGPGLPVASSSPPQS